VTTASSTSQSTWLVTARSTRMSSYGPVTLLAALAEEDWVLRDRELVGRQGGLVHVLDVIEADGDAVLPRPHRGNQRHRAQIAPPW